MYPFRHHMAMSGGLFYLYFNRYEALAKLVEKMLLLKAIVKKKSLLIQRLE